MGELVYILIFDKANWGRKWKNFLGIFSKKYYIFVTTKWFFMVEERDGSTEPTGSSASIHTSQKRITYNLEKWDNDEIDMYNGGNAR